MINDLGPADSRDAESAAVAARVKRAKATALNEIAMELNRKEIADIQSRAPHGGERSHLLALMPVKASSVLRAEAYQCGGTQNSRGKEHAHAKQVAVHCQ